MKITNSAAITVLGLGMVGALAYLGKQVPDAIGYIVGLYVIGRAGLKGTGMIAASRDDKADTQKAIETLKD